MTEFAGKIGRTAAESTPWWPEPRNRDELPPNIITIMFDDTGWSDFGCYGSEIRTPHIDALATGGLVYNNFHVTPLCSPSRASMLTGRNHHNVGMRCLSDTDTGFPNSRGRVRPDVPMLPSLLRSQGYATYMVGKWHLTPAQDITPAGPFDTWPTQCGFDRFYGFLGGCTDQFSPELYEDNHAAEPELGEGYHLSEDLTDRAMHYLREHVSFRQRDPLYLNLCFGATHAPFQVPKSYIDPYVTTFEKGWDQTRKDRLKRQIDMGLVPEGTALTPRNPEVPEWDSLDGDTRRLFTRLQACFAGFLEHTDDQIGRLVAELKRLDLFDNTIIMILSDNGASREGGPNGAVDTNSNYSGQPETVAEMLPRIDDIGGSKGPAFYPEGWAMAGNTPFRRYKQYVELGGVRSPLVVHWPLALHDRDKTRDQFLHAVDIAPTFLQLAGAPRASAFDGQSFAASFEQAAAPAPRRTQYWEMFGRRAIYADGWKAVSQHEKGDDYAGDDWRLHDLASDFSETHDLAARHPGKLKELQDLWWQEAEANDVLPLDDRTLVDIIKFRQPNGIMSAHEVTLYPGPTHVPQTSMITSSERSMEITAHFRGAVGAAEGVLISAGDGLGGYTLFIRQGALCFEHVRMGHRVGASAALDQGATTCGIRVMVNPDAGAVATLVANDRELARLVIPKVALHLSFWGLDVGRDAGLPVSTSYPPGFAFSDTVLDRVVMRFLEDTPATDTARVAEMTE
ncbi:arylsulfatase [Microbulbifer sp. S227A]|uniref:arylsulfatase n=1 Tax=Microbulbifer sp. S227A TaxID=3415131 RepID=UPI003C7AD7F0